MATQKVKEKLGEELNSEKVVFFLKNVLNANGLGLSNSPQNVNRFLDEIEESIDFRIIRKGRVKSLINDIKVYDKRILVRTNTIKSSKSIFFEAFKYEREDKINFKEVMQEVNRKLDYYDFIFLIRIDEEYEQKKVRSAYHYYLFPTETFKIKEIETINFDKHKCKASLSSKYWTFHGYKNFFLKYDTDLLALYDIYPPFVNC